MRNILLTIKYDGSGYHGWARQPGLKTVCGRMEEVLGAYFKMPIELSGASRTDAGVHAYGQRATLITELGVPVEKIPRVFNTALADDRLEGLSDIEVTAAAEMPEGFHARFDSKGKRYIYRIRNSSAPDIFLKRYRWQITTPLDIDSMRAACPFVVGEHDFACFQSAGSPAGSTVTLHAQLRGNQCLISLQNPVEEGVQLPDGRWVVAFRDREIYSLDIKRREDDPDEIELTIEGSAFLYNMVRIITGTLVETGLGKRAPEDMERVIASKDRANAGIVAPAGGLWLDEVFY